MKDNYIKSPLNYVGGKYKLLPQILPLFPENIDTFVDLFGGGLNVGINVKCNNLIYNDLCPQVVDLLKHFSENSSEYIHEKIINVVNSYRLDKCDKPKYLKLREDYNNKPDWIKFYTLITCSFSNQIRFNSKGEFNVPYGKRYYNISLQNKLKTFVEELHNKNVQFQNKDFRYYNFSSGDFVYCDPPYYNSTATYNENNGWSEQDEKELLSLLDIINDRNGKFALSNNLKYNNPLLDQWKNKYNVHYLNSDYSNCNYQKKDKSKDIEVLITNY